MGLLTNHKNAKIDISKLRDYCLNENHSFGKLKARVFYSALSLKSIDADYLKMEISKGLNVFNAVESRGTRYGKTYYVDMIISNFDKTKQAEVRTAWIILNGEEHPNLISCYVKKTA